jgi:hypothetical protein
VGQGKDGQVLVGLFAAKLEAADVFIDDVLHVIGPSFVCF